MSPRLTYLFSGNLNIMAIVDKFGGIHGAFSNLIYRSYRNMRILQMKPKKVKQTNNSKQAGKEFGLSSCTGRIIREVFDVIYAGYDGEMVNRLCSQVYQSITASKTKQRGERDLHDAELSYLEGFQFNNNSPLHKVMKVRPVVSLNQEGKVQVNLPAMRKDQLFKGPIRNHGKYTIRLMLASFDFKKEVYSYIGHRNFSIMRNTAVEAQEWVFDEALPANRVIMLSMSLHAYTQDTVDGLQSVNSKEWSPAEIIGAWHTPAVEEPASDEQSTEEENLMPMNDYWGNRLLQEIIALQAEIPPPLPNGPRVKRERRFIEGPEPDLPTGDIKFNK